MHTKWNFIFTVIINRFFENLAAPTCLMDAQSLMTKQSFFILRDPQQIRYLHRKFLTKTDRGIFCCLLKATIILLLESQDDPLNFQ